MIKIAGPGSESFSQRHGSPDPDPHQNVMDPQHCPTSMHVYFVTVSLWTPGQEMDLVFVDMYGGDPDLKKGRGPRGRLLNKQILLLQYKIF